MVMLIMFNILIDGKVLIVFVEYFLMFNLG